MYFKLSNKNILNTRTVSKLQNYIHKEYFVTMCFSNEKRNTDISQLGKVPITAYFIFEIILN